MSNSEMDEDEAPPNYFIARAREDSAEAYVTVRQQFDDDEDGESLSRGYAAARR